MHMMRRANEIHQESQLPDWEPDYDLHYDPALAELKEAEAKAEYQQALDFLRNRHEAILARLCGPATLQEHS